MKDSKINLILVGLLVAAAFLIGSLWTKVRTGEVGGLATTGAKTTPIPSVAAQPTEKPLPIAIGRFNITEEEVCTENGRPLVYFFGSNSCSYCKWEHPIIQKVAKKFGSVIIFRDNIDKLDSLEAKDNEVWTKNQSIHHGGIPFIVLGCKYVGRGAGTSDGKATEEKNLTAIICKLTNNQPASVCASVKDLVDQIK